MKIKIAEWGTPKNIKKRKRKKKKKTSSVFQLQSTPKAYINIINVLSRTWSHSCKHFVAKLGTAGIFSFLIF
jgi:hypothetical protein